MKIRHATMMALVSMVFCATAMALAPKEKLSVGDAAPIAGGWSSTGLIKQIANPEVIPGNPVVIEFWATWCGPCKRMMPHLSKLQKKYGTDQLNIIGVTSPDKGQTQSQIESFVKKQGTRMNYWVFSDEGQMWKDWMDAAGQKGIPCSFIVGAEGRIQYIGHPGASQFDEILEKVVRGRYDHASMTKAKKHLSEIKRAREMKNWEQYYTLSDKVIEIDPVVFYSLYMDQFDVELIDRDNPTKAYATAMGLLVNRQDDPQLLSWMAEHIAISPSIPNEKRNLDIALKLVESARKNGGIKDPALMASEAKIRMARDEVDQAIKLQRMAYFSAPKSRKDEYNRMLQDYKSQVDLD